MTLTIIVTRILANLEREGDEPARARDRRG